MRIYEVLIEYTSSLLNRPFSYVYKGEKEIKTLSRVSVPFNSKEVVGFVLNIIDTDLSIEEYTKKCGFIVKEIIDVIDDNALLTEELNILANDIAKYYYAPLISVYFAMLPPSLKPSSSSLNKPKISYGIYVKAKDNSDFEGLTTAQGETLFRIKESGKIKKSELSPSIINKLLLKDKIEIVKEERNRYQFDLVNKEEDFPLNEEQTNAYNEILSCEEKVILLDGVTGSGKTEVYMHVARSIIKQNKKIIMLVPEISLSYQMVRRFLSRFERIAILHSELTPGQRYDEYRRIRNGEVDIVIGARSAIFAPLENIGLIIIDEEHSETYKQSDQLPYYNALEVAKMRQKNNDAKILLGSATPSLETKSRALKGVYKHLVLTKRVNGLMLPSVELVDMSSYKNIDRESNLISKPLRSAIKETLEKKEQVILLVNRRGYSPYVSCRKCGYVLKCPECLVALTYHKETNKMMCHHCGYETELGSSCPKCESDKIFKSGFGTERIVQEINKLFPEAAVLRIDSDVNKKRNEAKKILESFASHGADILVGTQIVAKGHDFEDVTLVGIVLADIGLALPSFRASERTFNLITQALGRSGRKHPGKAIIQTYLKDNFVINLAAKQDYLSFYAKEIQYRKMLQNPPYTFMCLLLISGAKEDDVIDATEEVVRFLKMHQESQKNFSLIGPSEMFIKKYNNKYRRKVILKYKNFNFVRPLLDELTIYFKQKGSLTLTIDVDPYEDY